MCSPTGEDPEVLTAKYFDSAPFHDTGERSASILTLALVFIELDPKTFLRVVNLLQGSHGNGELTIAKSANPNNRRCTKPLGNSKNACRHVTVSHRPKLSCGDEWLRRAAMLMSTLGHLRKIDRGLAIGIVRTRQIGRHARFSEYQLCEATWATRRRLHSLDSNIQRRLYQYREYLRE
jgi:hypothetical protein